MKIKTGATLREWRMWLARKVAPAGADVHDPDETECPGAVLLLEAVLLSQIHPDDRGRYWLNVTDDLDDLAGFHGLIEGQPAEDGCCGRPMLTPAGERELARLWGPDWVSPWTGWRLDCCEIHGEYELFPGDRIGCPRCTIDRFVRPIRG